jgi:peptidoglycan/xylan/chitin deacetylase (PgdA/CDA1 family)
LFAALVVALLPSSTLQAGDTEIRLAFRYDDFGNHIPIEFESRLAGLFDARSLKATYGVIPMPLEGHDVHDSAPGLARRLAAAKADLLRPLVRKGLIEVAQHGRSHQSRIVGPPYSELKGLSVAQQAAMIREGSSVLEAAFGVKPTTFIPPWNSYDAATVEALKSLQVRVLSAGPQCPPEGDPCLLYVPATCDLPHLRDAIASARRSGEARSTVVVLFHAYDLREIDGNRGVMSFAELVELLDWVESQDDVRVYTLSGLAATDDDWSYDRYRDWCEVRKSSYYRLLGAAGVYPSQEATARIRRMAAFCRWLPLGVLVLAALSTGVVGRLALRGRSRRFRVIAACCVTVAFCCVLAHGVRHSELEFKGQLAAAALGGACPVAWLLARRPQHRMADAP